MVFAPSSLDRLSMYGIIPMDCTEFVYGAPSPYLMNRLYPGMMHPQYPQYPMMQPPRMIPQQLEPPKDSFGNLHADKPISKWKYYLSGGFATYIVAALLTKSLNPLKMTAKSAQGITSSSKIAYNWTVNGLKFLGVKIKSLGGKMSNTQTNLVTPK